MTKQLQKDNYPVIYVLFSLVLREAFPLSKNISI